MIPRENHLKNYIILGRFKNRHKILIFYHDNFKSDKKLSLKSPKKHHKKSFFCSIVIHPISLFLKKKERKKEKTSKVTQTVK